MCKSVKKIIVGVLAVFVVAALVIGCSPQQAVEEAVVEEAESSAPQEESEETYVVGVVQMVADLEWFRTVQMGIDAAAEDFGNVEVLVGNAQGTADEEAKIVENYIARGVDAILISPVDSKASIASIQAAQNEGIKVVIWNTMIESEIMDNYIGTDNYELGAQSGRFVVDYVNEHLDGKAKLVIMSLPHHEVGVIRTNGFKEAIAANPDIEIVAEQDGENPDAATDAVETILQANPDVDIIWAANEGGITGALNATEGRTDIVLIGTDMSLFVANKLLEEDNGLLAISTQDPYNIGYVSMETAMAMIKGEEVPSDEEKEFNGYALDVRRLIPLDWYTKDDLGRVQQYLAKYEALAN